MQDKDIDHSQSSFHSQSVIEEDPKINDYECITDSQVLETYNEQQDQREDLLKSPAILRSQQITAALFKELNEK